MSKYQLFLRTLIGYTPGGKLPTVQLTPSNRTKIDTGSLLQITLPWSSWKSGPHENRSHARNQFDHAITASPCSCRHDPLGQQASQPALSHRTKHFESTLNPSRLRHSTRVVMHEPAATPRQRTMAILHTNHRTLCHAVVATSPFLCIRQVSVSMPLCSGRPSQLYG